MRAIALLVACSACATAPPDGEPTAPHDPPHPADPYGSIADDGLAYASGDVPVPPLRLRAFQVSCREVSLGDDPDATSVWRVSVTTAGWASVTRGIGFAAWDGRSAPHRLVVARPLPLDWRPPDEPGTAWDGDVFARELYGYATESLAFARGGVALDCLDSASLPAIGLHDFMACGFDAADLVTPSCWFCGDHLGAAAEGGSTAVGRLPAPPGSPVAQFEATETVDCGTR